MIYLCKQIDALQLFSSKIYHFADIDLLCSKQACPYTIFLNKINSTNFYILI